MTKQKQKVFAITTTKPWSKTVNVCTGTLRILWEGFFSFLCSSVYIFRNIYFTYLFYDWDYSLVIFAYAIVWRRFCFCFCFFFYTTIAFIIYFSSGLWVCRKVREKLYNAPLDQKVSDEWYFKRSVGSAELGLTSRSLDVYWDWQKPLEST